MGTEQDNKRAETLYRESANKGNDIGRCISERTREEKGSGVLRMISL